MSMVSQVSAVMVIGAYGMPLHPPFSLKEEALPACKNLLHEIYDGPERTEFTVYLNVLQRKAHENLADLNTFEISMSLRD